MILGFAHLAINVYNLFDAELKWRTEGYTRNALYLSAKNHLAKSQFLTAYQSIHDLMLLNGTGLWPLELTCHGNIYSVNTQLQWNREAIQITVPKPVTLQSLLVKGLGFRITEHRTLVLENRLQAWTCRLKLQEGDTCPVSLDAAGPTCLAFYSNRIDEDEQRLVDLGATVSTGPFDITLGERNMTIAMLRVPGGLLVELIKPGKKNDHTNN